MSKRTQLSKRIWCELPDALLERLLPLLPVSSLLRFRCVCKSWNSYILSSHFLRICSTARSVPPSPDAVSRHRSDSNSYLLISTWSPDYPLLAYNPAHQTWHLPSIDFVSKEPELLSHYSLVAAAGGLLCVRESSGKLVVCNPVTKAMTGIGIDIEDGHGSDSAALVISLASMMYDDLSRSFKVAVVCSCQGDASKQVTCVYDSRRNSWTREKQAEDIFFESAGAFNGNDLFVVVDFPKSLMVMDATTATWRAHAAGVPAAVKYPSLVVVDGALVLLGALGIDENHTESDRVNAYVVWRLTVEGVWEEVGRMPRAMFNQIGSNDGFEGLSCVALDQGIYMVSSEGSVLFDMRAAVAGRQDTTSSCDDLHWSFLPQSAILSGLFACIKDVYSMRPSLDTLETS
ncbi:hypothetical protein KP509_33G002400 [Ceratopteris richardii]|uniref:F-box domain-containing protein n=1 Tax=Ceratopteris richardii TaxID=49495 RepID=A0A8T2QMN8_CERRI|nr:hypothetical protein KP509_33G002400 [Ceratopteris richardii]